MDAFRTIVVHLGHNSTGQARSFTTFLSQMTVDGNGIPKWKRVPPYPQGPNAVQPMNVTTADQTAYNPPFDNLPLEIKQKIFGIVFSTTRKELGCGASLALGGAKHSCIDCATTRSCETHQHEFHVYLPQDIEQLFVSTRWYLEAFPMFAKNTSLDLRYFMPSRALKITTRLPLLRSILAFSLSWSKTIQISGGMYDLLTFSSDTAMFASGIPKELDIYADERLYWGKEDLHEHLLKPGSGPPMVVWYRKCGPPSSDSFHTFEVADPVEGAGQLLSALATSLQSSLFFKRHGFITAQKLQQNIQSAGGTWKVRYWVTICCRIAYTTGRRTEVGKRILLGIDAETCQIIDFELNGGRKFEHFTAGHSKVWPDF
ncbi:hypothetical protein PMZ80_000018 [Knufia obscura]|uniref:Uncharacterized protein n=2 Tax=Knufia TaxID=430999 RepID=A0AAN8I3Q4_9EURO|nr:hypothetical protein PMZ80_000018 [Knufia obscura]KAK5948800.1 hypothetical protein OHC33_010224 [Knufia fluminis]